MFKKAALAVGMLAMLLVPSVVSARDQYDDYRMGRGYYSDGGWNRRDREWRKYEQRREKERRKWLKRQYRERERRYYNNNRYRYYNDNRYDNGYYDNYGNWRR